MAALPTICFSALRASISGAWETTLSFSNAQPSTSATQPCPSLSASTSRSREHFQHGEYEESVKQVRSRHRYGMGSSVLQQRIAAPIFGVSFSRKQRKQNFGVSAKFGAEAEKAFKTTVEIDKLIDGLRGMEYQKMPQVVAENVLAFDTPFWLRLAARADLCTSDDDKTEYEELASQLMTIVELIVQKTKENIESSTDVLKSIINPLVELDGEIVWPPRSQQSIIDMRKEVDRRDKENQLDEGFLSEVSAQLRQAKEDADKPGLVAILQKVLQLYAAGVHSKRSYAMKDGNVDKAEELLEKVLSADEEDWNNYLRGGLHLAGGSVQFEDLYNAIDRRVERTLMRTENGTYQQRVLVEYVREIETRARGLKEALQIAPPDA